MTRRPSLLAIGLIGLGGVLAAPAPPALADVIRLKNGVVLEGDIKKTDDGWVVTDAAGKRTAVMVDKVASIEARPKPAAGAAAGNAAGGTGATGAPDAGLASLRRVADAASDIKMVMTRYRTFIDQYANTPAGMQARNDLIVWQERLDKGMVKVGDKWVTQEEKKVLLEKSYDVARGAMELLKQAKLREAAPVIEQALTENPQNAAAWYLKGVLLHRQDQIVEARKAFEKTAALVPDHAPTFNNLAVIAWRQNQFPAALNHYDRALLAAPQAVEIVNNLAEALNALPADQRNGTVTKKVVRHFNEQELLLQPKMRERGLFRWGATWVNQEQLDKLLVVEREITDTLAKMSADFDAITVRVQQLEQDIDSNERLVKRMEMDSYGIDPATGRQIRYPLPSSYYDVVRDIAAFKSERAVRLAEQGRMRQAAKTIWQRLPIPKYTGLQRLIDTEGTPIPGAAAPTLPVPATPPPSTPMPPVAVTPTAPPPTPATPAPAAPTPVAPPTSPAGATTGTSTPPPATRPVRPPSPVPPEKPSIMDRRFAESQGSAANELPERLLDERPAE